MTQMETMAVATSIVMEPPKVETAIHQPAERERQVDSNTAFLFSRYMKQARRGIIEP
jgi:hypothetical protein